METLSTSQPPREKGRLSRRGLFWLVGTIALLAAIFSTTFIRTEWANFRADLTNYHGAIIGMNKRDTQYALDTPQTVQGPEIESEEGWLISSPLRVNPMEENDAIPKGYDPIPEGKSAMEYDTWHFWNDRGSFSVDFNSKTHRVESIICYSEQPVACDSLFGISIGTGEKVILERLGKPDKQEISGGDTLMGMPIQVSKTMDYDRLGLRLVLAKKVVTSISKRPAQDLGFWWWFTHGWTG